MPTWRDRVLAPALIVAVLAVGGCQTDDLAGGTASVQPSGQSRASRYDGTYRQTVDISTAKECPEDGPLTGVGVGELVFHEGSVQMWNWPEGHEDERGIAWDGTYAFFKDQLQVDDAMSRLTFDVRYDGTTLTLSNMRGGSCGDGRAWTTKPWVRQ